MIKKSIFLIFAIGSIFLCASCVFALIDKIRNHSTDFRQYLTQEEREKIPLLIALSLKEQCHANTFRTSFIEGLKAADLEKTTNCQESPEIRAFKEYNSQLSIDAKIIKNFEASTRYLQKQVQNGAIPLLNEKICYKIIKPGNVKGIDSNTDYNIRFNFTIKDIEDHFLAGNYTLSAPLSCNISTLISGMALGMQGMDLHEIREIYIHPEFAYGAFSNFASGRAIVAKVELLDCTPTNTPFHPSHLPVDLAKSLCNSSKANTLTSLQNDYNFFCGKTSWAFYKQRLPELYLDDLLPFLESDATLSFEDRKTLYKLQWLIYKSETNF